MNKLAATLTFISIMTSQNGWALSKASEIGTRLIVDMDCSLSEALILAENEAE